MPATAVLNSRSCSLSLASQPTANGTVSEDQCGRTGKKDFSPGKWQEYSHMKDKNNAKYTVAAQNTHTEREERHRKE